jgi:capsular polysaccharide biosynthesis protein
MELKQYWQIFWKRAWIPALLVAIVGVVSLLINQTPPPIYSTSMRFTVRVEPQPLTDQFVYEGYYGWLASEYLADDLTAIVSSQAFAAEVNRHLAELGSSLTLPAGVIGGVTVAEKQHRIIRLNASWPDATELATIAQAMVLAMEQDSGKYLTKIGSPGGAIISLIDPPTPPAAIPPSLTQRLNVPIRLLLALFIGLALAFGLDYLDDRVRGEADLEALGIPVLTQVPKGRG